MIINLTDHQLRSYGSSRWQVYERKGSRWTATPIFADSIFEALLAIKEKSQEVRAGSSDIREAIIAAKDIKRKVLECDARCTTSVSGIEVNV